MKLLESDCEIISAVMFHGDRSYRETARLLGLKEHTVRHAIEKLVEAKVLYPHTFVNWRSLGLTEYTINFTLTDSGEAARRKFQDTLLANDRVAWVGSLGGEIHYDVSVYGRQPDDLLGVFDDIHRNCPELKYEKLVLSTVWMDYYTPRYLGGQVLPRESIRIAPTETVVRLDAVDHRILAGIMTHGYGNLSGLARELKMPLSSLTYRIRMLQQRHVILSFGYLIRYYSVPFHPFLVMLRFGAYSSALDAKVADFCRRQPSVTMLLMGIGAWDYQLLVHLSSPQEVSRFSQEIHGEFPGMIQRLTPVPMVRVEKFVRYPFRLLPQAAGNA